MLQAITALPTVAIGPRRPFVLEVRPEGLKVRAATVADTGLGGLPAGRLVQQALEDLCDGQRTSLLITQALIRGLQDARVRVHAPESRLAFSFALRRLTPEWLCEAEDVLTTQQQRESGSNTALFGAWLRCMLRCELGGASFEAACRIVSGGMPYGPSRKSCLVAVTLDRPISDSRVCVGAMAVFNHRPQPRFPLLPSDGAVRTVVCAEFPIEVVAHDPRKETSSDDDDEDSSVFRVVWSQSAGPRADAAATQSVRQHVHEASRRICAGSWSRYDLDATGAGGGGHPRRLPGASYHRRCRRTGVPSYGCDGRELVPSRRGACRLVHAAAIAPAARQSRLRDEGCDKCLSGRGEEQRSFSEPRAVCARVRTRCGRHERNHAMRSKRCSLRQPLLLREFDVLVFHAPMAALGAHQSRTTT
jgi:hypothetical protein